MSETNEKTLIAQILSSYLSHNSVTAADLPDVIESVKRAFGGSTGVAATSSAPEQGKGWEPAVPVKKSVTAEAVTCLCCGAQLKSLKRHLQKSHQLDPAAYRAAFQLKADYPLVAPAYAEQRSNLAKALGLGRKPKAETGPKKRAPKARVAA